MKEHQNNNSNDPGEESQDLLYGRNSVIEALKSGRSLDCILMVPAEQKGSLAKIVAMAREKGIPVKETAQQRLDMLCGRENHQGVAAFAAVKDYASVEDILQAAKDKNEPPFIIVCDEIEDPHNLGAIIRTAEGAGVHGVIIPKRRSAGVNHTVYKTSAGACEYMPVAKVSNLVAAIDGLKKQGLWIYGAEMNGTPYYRQGFDGGVVLVIGSEGKGISRLLQSKCDFLVSLPMSGKINSLNASVAAGILMYEVVRQKSVKG